MNDYGNHEIPVGDLEDIDDLIQAHGADGMDLDLGWDATCRWGFSVGADNACWYEPPGTENATYFDPEDD